jgi:4-phospho-D-threonate 3-dehydrogenase / 4-phospho-D-erythronate 3-dehydrogenase
VKPLIGLTMGDAAGVGPEISLKAAAASAAFCRVFIIGDPAFLLRSAGKLGIEGVVPCVETGEMVFKKGRINVLDTGGPGLSRVKTGVPSPLCGLASVDYVKKAVSLALSGDIDALATAPISKQSVSMAGIRCAGHTELLEELCKKKAVMAFASGAFRIALASRHIPLARVPGFLSWSSILETVKILYDFRGDFGLKNPSFAVLALNPHAGDGGVLGSEDDKKIAPALNMIRKLNISADGPFPADGFFGTGRYEKYDFTVAMYHDQGLIPYKMKTFGKGVNVSVGLPVVRTSADHGTGFEIAGTGKADHSSMAAALKLAADMVRKRKASAKAG